jgi:hypothetical protein
MAIPTDESSCIAWHEAYNATEADTVEATQLVGVGGLPYAASHGTAGQYPTLQTLGSGRRAYRFDNTDDWLPTAAVLTARPFTVVAAFAMKSSATGKRVLCNGTDGSNWLVGPRSEVGSDYGFYNGSFIDSSVAADTDVVHVHSIRQRTSGTLADYRVDGSAVGTNSSTAVPGTLRIGGSANFGEPANCDLLGIAVFSTDLSDGALAAQETYWATGEGGVITTPASKLTQLVYESVQGANPNLRMTQHAIEVVNGANPNLRISQFVIELVLRRSRGYSYSQFI